MATLNVSNEVEGVGAMMPDFSGKLVVSELAEDLKHGGGVAVSEVDANPVECVMRPRQIECSELLDGGATTLQLVDVTPMSGKQFWEV